MQTLIRSLFSEQIQVFAKRFLFLLALYFLVRLAYLAYNWGDYQYFSLDKLAMSVLSGIRFDISALCFINFLPFLFSLFPKTIYQKEICNRVELYLFAILNIPFFLINAVDIELINFSGKRITRELLLLGQDVQTQAKDAILDYWGLGIFFVILCYFLVKSFPRKKSKLVLQASRRHFVSSFLVLALLVIGARGGLQYKPLQGLHAYRYSDPKLAFLTLNSSFTLIKSFNRTSYQPMTFYKKEEVKAFLSQMAFRKPETKSKKLNVFLIILESFSLEYTGAANAYEGFTPFLDELSQEGIYLKNSFANGRRSIEAVPSTVCGIPKMMDDAFITSPNQNNEIQCFPHILSNMGYISGFFHGAKNGTMYFDSFSKRVGYDSYYGLNEYPDKQDFDGAWGIYDHKFFAFTLSTVNSWSKPFFATLFSMSSHHPYKIPESMKERFPKGSMEIHQSIAYADFSLRKLIEAAKKQDWFKDTLFIITADHTSKSADKNYGDILGRYRVPLLYYFGDPAKNEYYKRLISRDRISQHTDILPTVMDFLGVPNTYKMSRFGSSLLADSDKGFAIFGNDVSTIYVEPDRVEYYVDKGMHRIYRAENSWILEELNQNTPALEPYKAKMFRQYYFNALLKDQWLR